MGPNLVVSEPSSLCTMLVNLLALEVYELFSKYQLICILNSVSLLENACKHRDTCIARSHDLFYAITWLYRANKKVF